VTTFLMKLVIASLPVSASILFSEPYFSKAVNIRESSVSDPPCV